MSKSVVVRPWEVLADSVYDLVVRLANGEGPALTGGEEAEAPLLLPCLCALAVYAAECGHTCLPLDWIAGRTLGEALDLLSKYDSREEERSGFRMYRLPARDVLGAQIGSHPEIVEIVSDRGTKASGTAPFVLRDDGGLRLRRHDQDEWFVADWVRRLAGDDGRSLLGNDEGLTEQERAFFPKKGHAQELDEEKIAAAELLMRRRFSILNGGPGTGKTYTLARVLACALQHKKGLRVRLAAPSAKAAARMKQSIAGSQDMLAPYLDDVTREELFGGGEEEAQALTVDKLLEKRRDFVTYKHNEENPLDADWVIIDEASMLSLPMAADLIRALPSKCRLTLIGDYNQLPSVDLGRVFADLCAEFPSLVATLRTSNRFEPGGAVDQLSRAMLKPEGEVADAVMTLLKMDEIRRVVIWHPLEANAASQETAWQEFDARIGEGFGPLLATAQPQEAVDAIGKFCVLSAMRHRGKIGCLALNRRIEGVLEQVRGEGDGAARKFPRLCLVTENVSDGHLHLHNGDSFVVLPGQQAQAVMSDGHGSVRTVPLALVPQWEPAFAETVHKVQGSEYAHVAIVLSDAADSPLLTREIFYTALTRVMQGGQVDIWSSEAAIRKCVSTPTSRFTGWTLRNERQCPENG